MHIEPSSFETDTADVRRKASAPAAEYVQLRVDLSTRLGRVCGDMPPEAFEALVDDICAMKVRWARTSAVGRGD